MSNTVPQFDTDDELTNMELADSNVPFIRYAEPALDPQSSINPDVNIPDGGPPEEPISDHMVPVVRDTWLSAKNVDHGNPLNTEDVVITMYESLTSTLLAVLKRLTRVRVEE